MTLANLVSRPPSSVPTALDPRWAAVRARDVRADGTFVYAVRTTGVYCRPSCASRPARPENVELYATPAAAERAGFRACKRCLPDQPPKAERQAKQVAQLCRFIEQSEETPSLQALAEHAGLSVYHTHRLFKSVTGLTPRAYAAAQKAGRVREALRTSGSVTEAIYGAGYGSSGRFYATSNDVLGMTPSEYRAGGAQLAIHVAFGRCSLGVVLVAGTARGLCAILLGDDRAALAADLERRFPKAEIARAGRDFQKLVEKVVALVESPSRARAAELPLDIRGTAFQQRVWRALTEIPSGETTTYSQLARALGAPGSARAVAGACAANALAVAIPCHRVVRSDGDVSGYRWGVERKRALLARETKR